jgi:hypothetical protein
MAPARRLPGIIRNTRSALRLHRTSGPKWQAARGIHLDLFYGKGASTVVTRDPAALLLIYYRKPLDGRWKERRLRPVPADSEQSPSGARAALRSSSTGSTASTLSISGAKTWRAYQPIVY